MQLSGSEVLSSPVRLQCSTVPPEMAALLGEPVSQSKLSDQHRNMQDDVLPDLIILSVCAGVCGR